VVRFVDKANCSFYSMTTKKMSYNDSPSRLRPMRGIYRSVLVVLQILFATLSCLLSGAVSAIGASLLKREVECDDSLSSTHSAALVGILSKTDVHKDRRGELLTKLTNKTLGIRNSPPKTIQRHLRPRTSTGLRCYFLIKTAGDIGKS